MVALIGGVLVLHAPSTSAAVEQVRRRGTTTISCGTARGAGGMLAAAEEDHYRTLRVTPGASKGEVKRAFRHLALQFHPDVVRRHHHESGSNRDGGMDDFQRISVAYQVVMGNMREAEERLEYWRRRYGLSEEELDRYWYYLNDDGDDDWLDM